MVLRQDLERLQGLVSHLCVALMLLPSQLCPGCFFLLLTQSFGAVAQESILGKGPGLEKLLKDGGKKASSKYFYFWLVFRQLPFNLK